ncbi:MAG: alkaline phosphatase D family protein [Kofleriaceae bacterium]
MRVPIAKWVRQLERRALTRRSLLRGAAAALLFGACGDDRARGGDGRGDGGVPPPDAPRGPAPGELVEAPLSTFPLGVASGDAGADRVSLWGQYRGLAALYVAVWEVVDEAYGDVVAWARVNLRDGGFGQVDLDGLAPGAPYVFAFVEVVDDEAVGRSALGQFRTALAPDEVAPLRFGATSCTRNRLSMAAMTHAGSRDDLAFFALLGDTFYNARARTRDEFRLGWAENLRTLGYRQLRASTSVLATWDDHEIANNWDPESLPEPLLLEGSAALFEHLPIRRDRQRPDRIYRSTRWGKTVEVFVLDCRSERRPSTRLRADAQYLSRAQMDWLKSGLAASPCAFKVILNSVPITNFPSVFDVVAADRWEGYPAARQEILSFIEGEAIGGVLWLSGDFHFASAGRVAPAGQLGASALEVLVGPAAQDPNPLWAAIVDTPQFDFASGTNNYAVIDLEPGERRATFTFHDPRGDVFATRSFVV